MSLNKLFTDSNVRPRVDATFNNLDVDGDFGIDGDIGINGDLRVGNAGANNFTVDGANGNIATVGSITSTNNIQITGAGQNFINDQGDFIATVGSVTANGVNADVSAGRDVNVGRDIIVAGDVNVGGGTLTIDGATGDLLSAGNLFSSSQSVAGDDYTANANLTLNKADDAGKVFSVTMPLNGANIFDINLPDPTLPASQGARYTFIVVNTSTAGAGDNVRIQSTGANEIQGVVLLNNTVAPITAQSISFIGGTVSVGSKIELACGDGVYSVIGSSPTAGAIA